MNLSRNARLALVFAALTVLCGGAVCFAAVRIAPVLLGLDCEPSQTPSVSPVYTDTVAVSRRFPRLGPIEQAHWQSRQARPRTCPDIGPMDYITEGLVTLEPQTAAGYRRDHSWTPATPEIPAALAASVPAGARWTHSQDFDVAMGTGTFYADAGSATLYFVHHTS